VDSRPDVSDPCEHWFGECRSCESC